MRTGLLLGLFFVALLLPINLEFGGFRTNPSRLFLLLTAIPFGLQLFGGKAGGVTWVDRSMLGFAVLVVTTLLYHHGMAQFPYAVSQALEMFGGYMTGRILIRSMTDYRRFIGLFLLALLFLLPLAVDEVLHSRMLLADVFSKVFSVVRITGQTRFGLARAQVVFPQAILYGLFCSLAAASVFFLYRQQPFRRLAYLGLVLATTFLSLSSAPMISVFLQLGLIAWGLVTGGSWKLLAGIVAFIFLILQLFTNRGALVIFIETMTLDPETGWWRLLILEYGSQDVMAYPLLGNGLNDWARPEWMYTSSVDNFWLLMAMRHGLPCLALILVAFVLHIALALRAKGLGEEARMMRTGYIVTLIAVIFILTTVDVWDAVSVFVMFFLGAGAFLYTADLAYLGGAEAPATAGGLAAEPASGPRFSRFPQTAGIARRRDRSGAGHPEQTPPPLAQGRTRSR